MKDIKYLEDIRLGMHYAYHHKFIFNMLLFGFGFMFLIAAPSFLTYIQVARVFGPETWRLSLLEALFGSGMLLGSILISLWVGFKNRLKTYFIGFIFVGLSIVGLGLPFNFIIYLACWSCVGFFMALSNPILITLLQEKVEPLYMGRIFSLYGAMQLLSMPLGMLLFGPLADVLNVSYIILGSGLLYIFIASIGLMYKKLLIEGIKVDKTNPETP